MRAGSSSKPSKRNAIDRKQASTCRLCKTTILARHEACCEDCTHSNPQGKLVRVVRGEVFDVAADINPASQTFGQWVGVVLSDANHRQLWIPPGYAHGFVVLSDIADFEYKCTDYYSPQAEIGVIWNDPDLNIAWPIDNPKLSEKDLRLPTLAEIRARA
jgi:dTDP-4-dehydrorhamnose 3,5-epimerase